MRIEQLEYLEAVTKHGSVRRASEQLHVSQPAVSEGIRKLERELGVNLLERNRTGSRISLAGRELLQSIVEVLESVDRLRSAAGDQLSTRRLIRVGSVNTGTASLTLPAVRAFQEQHPGSTVEVRTMQQDDIQIALVEGSLELGLINLLEGDDVPPELQPTVLLTGRPVVVMPLGHRLATQESVSVDDLRSEHFVAMRSGYVMHRFAHRLFGTDIPTRWSATDGAEMGKMMVAEDIGLTILPDYSVTGDPLERGGIITARPLRDDQTVLRLVSIHHRQNRLPHFIRDLLDHLVATAAESV